MRQEISLKEYRDANGLSQAAIGELIDADQAEISKFENGVRTPTLEKALKIEEITKGEIPVKSWKKSRPTRKLGRRS